MVLDADYDKRSLSAIKSAVKRVLKRDKKGPSELTITLRVLKDGIADYVAKQTYRNPEKRENSISLTAEDVMLFYLENKKPGLWPG